jgi:hypothetical protein
MSKTPISKREIVNMRVRCYDENVYNAACYARTIYSCYVLQIEFLSNMPIDQII